MYPNNIESRDAWSSFCVDPFSNLENTYQDERTLPASMNRESQAIDSTLLQPEFNRKSSYHFKHEARLICNGWRGLLLSQTSAQDSMGSLPPLNSIVQAINEEAVNIHNQARINKDYDQNAEGIDFPGNFY